MPGGMGASPPLTQRRRQRRAAAAAGLTQAETCCTPGRWPPLPGIPLSFRPPIPAAAALGLALWVSEMVAGLR